MAAASSQSLFSSFSHLMFLQLVSRALTFTLNSALLRLASARAYGTAAIQFEFLLSTILFLSREGVRNALLRSKTPHAASTRNVSFIPLLLGLPLSAAAFVLYPRFASEETRRQGHFTAAVAIYVIAALAELLCEPMHNLTMAELRTDIRVRAEGFAMTAKTVTTFLVLFYDARAERDGDLALIAFGAGQLCYSCALLLIYIPHYGVSLLRSTKPDSGPYFDPALVRLATTMTSQSFMKHILTEGDKVILSVFSPLEDQGGYAVAVNYGSLLARIVFQPIEETLRVYFSKTLSANDPAAATLESSNTLETLLSTQISLSAIFVTFAHPYAPLLLNILLPRQYRHTSARTVLSAWVWYIPLLSVNGGLEAFVSSVADGAALNQQSRYMTVISPLYIAAALFFYKIAQFGDRSLVYANMINLVARIAYALHFAWRRRAPASIQVTAAPIREGKDNNKNKKKSDEKEERNAATSPFLGASFGLRDILPSAAVLAACVASTLGLQISARVTRAAQASALLAASPSLLRELPALKTFTVHVASGGVMGFVCLCVWWMSEGRRHVSRVGWGKVKKA